MSIKPFKIVVHNDLDGGASAICILNHIKQKYGMYAMYSTWFGSYDKVDMIVERLLDNPSEYEKIFIADISVHPELAKEFSDNVILLDHHETAKPLDGIKKCIVDTSGNHCGASLCYKHLLKDQKLEYKHLTKLVQVALDYDLWHLKLPNNIAKNLNYLYYYYWGEKFIDRFKEGFTTFNDEEKEFLQKKWQDINDEVANATYINVMDGKHSNTFCLIVDADGTEVNEVCEHALKDKKYHIVMCANPVKHRISTRISAEAAAKGLHIGKLHQELKIGGGHERAAGASYQDDKHLESICEKICEKIIEFDI